MSAFGISRELIRVTWKENIIQMVEVGSMHVRCQKHNRLTKPITAEIRNVTQSIGVKLGFFFSGYNTMLMSGILGEQTERA